MADAAPRTDADPVALTLTLSSEPAFLGTTEALVARVGEHAGCTPEAAKRLGQAVRRLLGALIERAREAITPPQLEVAFAASDRVVRVDLRVARGMETTDRVFEDLLAAEGAGAGLERLVDRVEIAREDGRPCCRITQQVRAGR
jgi:hypothetical protein